jgi:putative lipoprotein
VEADDPGEDHRLGSYVQKVALPPNSTVELRLEDVSRPDAPAILIAKDEVPTRGRQVPIAFELKYDSTLIQAVPPLRGARRQS